MRLDNSFVGSKALINRYAIFCISQERLDSHFTPAGGSYRGKVSLLSSRISRKLFSKKIEVLVGRYRRRSHFCSHLAGREAG